MRQKKKEFYPKFLRNGGVKRVSKKVEYISVENYSFFSSEINLKNEVISCC